MAKHKHLRDLSPEEKTLPKKFSVRRDVAYLFEEQQPKFGNFKNVRMQIELADSRLVGAGLTASTLARITEIY